jgi:vanillate/3-O-methylgallate O-demethylase
MLLMRPAIYYGQFVKFDHDFIGRDALHQIDSEAQRKEHAPLGGRRRGEDLRLPCWTPTATTISSSICRLQSYGSSNFDSVVDAHGTLLGLSMLTGCSANEKRAPSLGHGRSAGAAGQRGAGDLGASQTAAPQAH